MRVKQGRFGDRCGSLLFVLRGKPDWDGRSAKTEQAAFGLLQAWNYRKDRLGWLILPDSVSRTQNDDQQNKQDQYEGCRCKVSSDCTRHANSSFMKNKIGGMPKRAAIQVLSLSSVYIYCMKAQGCGLDT
jgi:hypothetical protein